MNDLRRLLDNLLALRQDHLNVAGIRHVRVDATVSAVCTTSLLGSLVDLDVLDDEVACIETLGVCVRLGVLEQTDQEFGGLDGPSCFGDAELLAYITVSLALSHLYCFLRSVCLQCCPAVSYSPCAVRPVLPAYRLIGTASLCSLTFSRNCRARTTFLDSVSIPLQITFPRSILTSH